MCQTGLIALQVGVVKQQDMKRILFAIAGLLTLVACSQTDPPQLPDVETTPVREGRISRKQAEEALLKARSEFYPETRGATPRIASCQSYGRGLSLATRTDDEPAVYVFNFEDNQGFAIMAATPALPELIAISDKGNLDLANLPDNGVRDFVSLLSDWTIDRPDTAVHEVGDVYTVTSTRDAIITSALCRVKWNQGYPYNQYTPIVNGVHAQVGCGGVAVAQAMSIYGRPTSLEGYTFDWDAMIDENPTADGIDQLARFMEVIGRTGIGNFLYDHPEGTACFIPNLVDILHLCGYEKAIYPEYVLDKATGATAGVPYRTLDILGELGKLRPVIVFGTTDGDFFQRLGHFWLLHGYMQRQKVIEQRKETEQGSELLSRRTETEDYVLCNWGWSGVYDGYYLNGVFDQAGDYIPDGNSPDFGDGFDYSTGLRAIINIYPANKWN